MATEIAFRALEPDDSGALINLISESPDTGAITFRPVYKADIWDVFSVRRTDWQGVVAESDGRLVGLGMVGFDTLQIEGSLHPTAYFFSLVVHPNYRRRGIAKGLGAWRLQKARERFGDDAIIYANIQSGNVGSEHNAKSWSSQFLSGIQSVPVKALSRPPRPLPQYTVRPIQVEELEEAAARMNTFYADYNFYAPETAESLRRWVNKTLDGQSIHQLWGVTDARGALLAGVCLTEQSRYMDMLLERVPMPIRLANILLQVIPPDGVLRQVDVHNAWFLPHHLSAAHYLWDVVRYELRTKGNTFFTVFDSRGPLVDMFAIPRWMPRAHLGVAVYAPFTLSQHRLVCAGI